MLVIARRRFLLLAPSLLAIPVSGELNVQHVGGARQSGKRSKVIAACTKHWPENKGDCSGFVRAVGNEIGLTIAGNANSITDTLTSAPWINIGVGKAASEIAGVTAGEGNFVVAGRKDSPNGHVAIIVDYRNAFDSYDEKDRNKAVAFWGQLRSVGKEYTRLTMSWTAADLEEVRFAYQAIP